MNKFLKIEYANHALTVLFGVTSLANVNAFLRGAGHDPAAAIALSVALGAALIVVSIALTKLDWQSERQTFWTLGAVGALLAVVSGSLQASEYNKHLAWGWAVTLGFAVPCIGEIGLSLATALYLKALGRSELRAVHAKMEGAVVAALGEAIETFDTSLIRRRVDRSLNAVAGRAVEGVTQQLMAFYGGPVAAGPVEIEVDSSPNVNPVNGDLALANAVRLSKKTANMDKTFALIQSGDRALGAIAGEVGVSEKTITRYIDAFRLAGHRVEVNGVVKLG